MPDLIDPISGLEANPIVQQDVVLEGYRKKQSQTRALMDIRSMNNPEETPDDLYNRTKADVDMGIADQLMEEELLAYSARKEQEALELAQQASITNPESVQRSANILEALPAVRERFADIDGYQQAVIDHNSPLPLESFRAQQSAVKGRAYQILEQLSEDNNTLDTVVDYAALLVPDYIKDASDLVDGNLFTSPSDLNAAVEDFQNRSPDEQAILIEEIVPALWDAYDGNAVKVSGMLGTLFNQTGSGTDIALGVGFDAFMVADAAAIMKAGKAFMSARSIASRAADAEGIEEAARRQIIASVDNEAVEDAVGMTKVDAAHTANPMPTRMIDDIGSSVDDIAGEVDKLKASGSKIVNEDAAPVSATTIPAQEFKALKREQTVLQKVIAEESTPAAMRAGAEARLAQIEEYIRATNNAPKAEKELSSLMQGEVPEEYSAQFGKAVEEAKADMRATRAEIESNPVDTKTENELNMEAVENLGRVQEVKDEFNRLIDNIITPRAFTPEEETAAIAKAQERLTKELTEDGLSINSMNVVARDDTGFTLRYATTSGEGERTLNFTRDDVGSVISKNDARTFKQNWRNLFGRVFSPEVLLEDVFPDLVKDATFAGQQAARLRNGLGQLWQDAEKGLSKQEKFEVDSILMAGDEESRVYSIAELRDGLVETQNGVLKLTDAQVESYYAKRAFFDELHSLRAFTTKRQLEIEGYENLAFTNSKGAAENLVGRRRKNFDTSDFKASEQIFFPEDANKFHKGSIVDAKKQFYKDEGYEIVELLQPIHVAKGSEARFALVKRESKWSGLPDEVLNYQAGYVPRIYPKGYFYVRNMDSANKEVLYAFPTREKAKEWSDSVEGNTAVFADREFNAAEQIVEDSNAYGGLYTGTRKTRPLMVKDGDREFRPDRMSVGNATERYVQNISAIMPLSEYRATTLERWKNTVNNLAEAQGRSGLGREQRFDSAIDLEKDTKDVMEQARSYIQDVMKMPTREERISERIALGAANMLYGKPFAAKPRQWLLDNSQGSVSDWIKGVSFNMHMGWFNLRQLFVQMQNASLTISMNPDLAIPALGDVMSLRTLAHLNKNQAAQAAKHMGLGDDVIDSYNGYVKSGLRDSIVRQADFDNNAVGISHGSIDAARKLSKAGRVFFNEGENFSRLLSWSIARRKWKTANPSKKAMTDADIQEVSQEALRMQMNLQSENAAWWQTAPGINVATQFLQVQAKFLENVMPKVLGGSGKWTAQEKRRAMAGQLFLYGVVGVPIAEEAVSYVAQLNNQSPQEFMEENPTFVDSINEGFVGMIATLLGGEDLAPTESFSLLAGLDDNVIASLIDGAIDVLNGGYSEEGAIEMFTGPSANIIRRVGDVGSGLMLTLKSLYEVPSLDVAYGGIISNMDDIAGLTSTWTNARKLYTLHNSGRLMSSRGSLIATSQELGDLSLTTQLGIAMGFPTDKELHYYNSKESVKSAMQFRKDATKDVKQALIQYTNTGNESLYKAKLSVILMPFSATERMDIMRQVNKDALKPKTGLDRTLKQSQRLFIESNGRVEPTVSQSQLLSEDVE